MSFNKRSFGDFGEEIAVKYLIEKGYRIKARNFRAGRLGEIDIIAGQSEYICFVEVKARTGTEYGLPSEAVDRRKQENIRRTAQVYISRFNLEDCYIRFDVVEIILEKIGDIRKVKEINLLKNAF